MSSCCHFCGTKVVTRTRYVLLDFAECDLFYPENPSYTPLTKKNLNRFASTDLMILLNNLALREKEVKALRAVFACYRRILLEASENFNGGDSDE